MSIGTFDTELIKRRDSFIVRDFTKMYDLDRKRFDDVMYKLRWEKYFLSERKIKEILKKGGAALPYSHRFNHVHKEGLDMQQARNNKLVERYKFYTETKKMRHDDSINLLHRNEFFLNPITIERIVSKWNPGDDREQTLFDNN